MAGFAGCKSDFEVMEGVIGELVEARVAMGAVVEIDFGCGAAAAGINLVWGMTVELDWGPPASCVGCEAKRLLAADIGLNFTAWEASRGEDVSFTEEMPSCGKGSPFLSSGKTTSFAGASSTA